MKQGPAGRQSSSEKIIRQGKRSSYLKVNLPMSSAYIQPAPIFEIPQVVAILPLAVLVVSYL